MSDLDFSSQVGPTLFLLPLGLVFANYFSSPITGWLFVEDGEITRWISVSSQFFVPSRVCDNEGEEEEKRD